MGFVGKKRGDKAAKPPRAGEIISTEDRKSTRLNSSHSQISYAVFCLKKKKTAPSVLLGQERVAVATQVAFGARGFETGGEDEVDDYVSSWIDCVDCFTVRAWFHVCG